MNWNDDMTKKGFMDGYKKYDDSNGRGSPEEWESAFRERMSGEEAREILRDDDPLTILNLPKNPFPTKSQIKKSFRILALKWHPDRNPGNQEESSKQFKKIYAAYILLYEDD